MLRRRRNDAAARLLFLLGLAAAEAFAIFEVDEDGLLLDGRRFVALGTVYSNTPVGRQLSTRLEASACLYDRDFPLIAAAGGNTIRTRARVDPVDRAFPRALETSGLYWLAGFPLDSYFNSNQTLSKSTEAGRNLRVQILRDFTAYAEAWAEEPRLIGFVFGDGVAANDSSFYSLLAEAGEALANAGLGEVLLTTSVRDPGDIGATARGTRDDQQPRLAFWSVDATGRSSLEDIVRNVRSAKPLLISAFGIDAFDGVSGSEDADTQADVAGRMATDVRLRSHGKELIGGLWTGFVDEWALGGPNPAVHGSDSEPADGEIHRGWLGLFGTRRSGVAGLDSLRPRGAYFALAGAWEGNVAEDALGTVPLIAPDGLLNYPSSGPILARGGLFSIAGEHLSSRQLSAADPLSWPSQLGAVSVCVNGLPAPLVSAGAGEVRGQIPWEVGAGRVEVVSFSAGAASNPAETEIRESAPGILPGAVFRPGLPCPVDMYNGVRPGSYLEIYSTGLGEAGVSIETGSAPAQASPTLSTPAAHLSNSSVPVLYSGLFPGAVGVYQTNVKVPDDASPGNLNLQLLQGGTFSNIHQIRIVANHEEAFFGIADPSPTELTIQEGGEAASTSVEILGAHGFCSLVRLQVIGAPPGVRISAPVGVPGERVEVRFHAEFGAPRAFDAPIKLTARSVTHQQPERELRLTVLPSQGDIRYRVVSAGWLTGSPSASFELEGRTLRQAGGGGPGRGFNILTIDSATGLLGKYYNFDTWGSEEAVEALENFVLALPEGALVLAAIADDGQLLITDRTLVILRERLGSELIDQLKYQWSWAIITRVGAERPIAEGLAKDRAVDLERVLSLPLSDN